MSRTRSYGRPTKPSAISARVEERLEPLDRGVVAARVVADADLRPPRGPPAAGTRESGATKMPRVAHRVGPAPHLPVARRGGRVDGPVAGARDARTHGPAPCPRTPRCARTAAPRRHAGPTRGQRAPGEAAGLELVVEALLAEEPLVLRHPLLQPDVRLDPEPRHRRSPPVSTSGDAGQGRAAGAVRPPRASARTHARAATATAGSCSGFISTLRRMRAPRRRRRGADGGRSSVVGARSRRRLRYTGSRVGHARREDRGAGAVDRVRRGARRPGRKVTMSSSGATWSSSSSESSISAAHARAARTPAARIGPRPSSRVERQRLRASATGPPRPRPAREHSRLISPRCSSAEVK